MIANPTEYVERMRDLWLKRHPPLRNQGPLPKFQIDWAGYFRSFCDRHGKYPLVYRGRLLFPDGWGYSFDHAGPAFPPPEDGKERRALMRIYWKLRRSAVKKELPAAKHLLEEVRSALALAKANDSPIEYATVRWDETASGGKGGYVRQNRPLSEAEQMLAQRLAWLEEDLELCERMIINPEQTEHEAEFPSEEAKA